MVRKFVYEDRVFDDIDPSMSVEEVKKSLSDFFGELANAEVSEEKDGDDTIYRFTKKVGTKGGMQRSERA